jgi:ATP/maltotriose-dependent transcriptional regulator MalT
LACLALRDAEDPDLLLASLSRPEAEFADHLTDDALSRRPLAILSFLHQTATLDHFRVALREAVATSEDPEWSALRCMN